MGTVANAVAQQRPVLLEVKQRVGYEPRDSAQSIATELANAFEQHAQVRGRWVLLVGSEAFTSLVATRLVSILTGARKSGQCLRVTPCGIGTMTSKKDVECGGVRAIGKMNTRSGADTHCRV